MQSFPHHYEVRASARVDGDVSLSGDGLDPIATAPPASFGGPGDRWSPETLLVGSVADCFTLTFRAVARASKLDWSSLACTVEGTLDRADGVASFTQFTLHATLGLPAETGEEQARRLLEKAEKNCLITNSLSAPTHLEITLERD